MKEGRVTLLCTVLMLRWLRLTRSISGVSGRAVPPPKSSLYWILTWMRNKSFIQLQPEWAALSRHPLFYVWTEPHKYFKQTTSKSTHNIDDNINNVTVNNNSNNTTQARHLQLQNKLSGISGIDLEATHLRSFRFDLKKTNGCVLGLSNISMRKWTLKLQTKKSYY